MKIDPSVLLQTISMIMSGIITMTLLTILSTFIIHKLAGLRFSAASFISSSVCTWPSALIVLALLPENPTNNWIVALFMLIFLIIFLSWMYIFQPDSLVTLTQKEIKRNQFKKISIAKSIILTKAKEAKKNNDLSLLKALEKELEQINQEKKLLKNHYSKINKFKNILIKFKTAKKEA